jgi:hypothetical protein
MQLQGIPEQIQKVLLSTKHSLFYPKSGLLNGHNSVNFDGHFYLKVAKTSLFSNRTVEEFSLGCSIYLEAVKLMNRTFSEVIKMDH